MFVRNYYMYKWYMEYVYGSTTIDSDFMYSTLPLIINYDGTTSISDSDSERGTMIVGRSPTITASQYEAWTNRVLWFRPNASETNTGSNNTGYFARVGLSDTAESIDDYELAERDDALACTINSNIISTIDDDFNFVRTINLTVQNTSDTDKEIKEVGLYKRCSGTYYTYKPIKLFLFLRQVLDTPVNIPAGKNTTIIIQAKETLKPV